MGARFRNEPTALLLDYIGRFDTNLIIKYLSYICKKKQNKYIYYD